MPVPKTEIRLPFSFQATDLGEAVVSSDSQVALVSYNASPLAQGRKQTYVLFVLNATLQTNLERIRWQVNNRDITNQETTYEFTPTDTGTFQINLTLFNNQGAELSRLSFSQVVAPVNQELENLITQDDVTHPIAGDPATSREIINDLLIHLHAIAAVPAQEVLNRLLFGIAYIEALDHAQTARDQLLQVLRDHINSDRAADFFRDAAPGAGICRLRPELLAMTIQEGGSTLIPWETLPTGETERQAALTRIRTVLAALPEPQRIDLFNVLRFPKASLKATQLIIDNLRTRLFGGSTLETIMPDSTNATNLINQFKTGPLAPATP